LIIGAQKSGTTSLFAYLDDHPAVAAAMTKEVHYFDLNSYRDERWYRAHFPTALQVARLERRLGVRPAVIEASPYYLAHPCAPYRAHDLVPEAKLIVLLRDPVARAISHYHQAVASGSETLPLRAAVAMEPERLRGQVDRIVRDPTYDSFDHRKRSYLERGRYADQLSTWLGLFQREQLLVLDSSLLFRDPAAAVRRVCEFLGIPPPVSTAYEALNSRPYAPPDPEVDRLLREHFAESNQRLRELTGQDFEWA
jgi:hypothetical protein